MSEYGFESNNIVSGLATIAIVVKGRVWFSSTIEYDSAAEPKRGITMIASRVPLFILIYATPDSNNIASPDSEITEKPQIDMSASIENNANMACPLSIIIIGRNEEQFIGQCIESALESCLAFPNAEVIFVDSASTDRSVEIASKYPIQIYQLHRGQKRSPSAGRFIGYQYAKGEYLFFVDGDSIVASGWATEGIRFLVAHAQYAGVAGVLEERYLNRDGLATGGVKNLFEQDLSKEFDPYRVLCGPAIYRRSAMAQVGTFNPYLPTGEEGEVGLRLRRAGWSLARLSCPMALKNTEDRKTFYEVIRRLRTSFYDYGIVIRHASEYGGGIQYAWDCTRFVVTTLVGLVLFSATCLFALYAQALYLVPIALLAVIMITVVRKGGFKAALLSFAVRLVSSYCTLRSWLFTSFEPVTSYPTDAIRLK
jgi:cellulose synthase/poly-beta-1,6-N-acetylglucosamine synthase-like glycosyltransferase